MIIFKQREVKWPHGHNDKSEKGVYFLSSVHFSLFRLAADTGDIKDYLSWYFAIKENLRGWFEDRPQ